MSSTGPLCAFRGVLHGTRAQTTIQQPNLSITTPYGQIRTLMNDAFRCNFDIVSRKGLLLNVAESYAGLMFLLVPAIAWDGRLRPSVISIVFEYSPKHEKRAFSVGLPGLTIISCALMVPIPTPPSVCKRRALGIVLIKKILHRLKILYTLPVFTHK